MQESKSRLENQQKRNLNDREPHLGFGVDELREASPKGLGTAIQEIQGGVDTRNELAQPVNPVLKSSDEIPEDLQEELESVKLEGDMMSHLDNLEAEVWAAVEAAEKIDASDNSATSAGGGVVVGGASLAQPVVRTSTIASGKVELKRTGSPLSRGKKTKVTSVEVKVRRSSRSDDSKMVESQPQPVKQVIHYAKPVNQAAVVQEWEQDPQPVVLRRHREPVSKQVLKERPAAKPEKTAKQEKPASSISRKEARRSYM